MSNHHIEDLPLSSSSKQMTSSRPQHQEKPAQQEGSQASLPVEALPNISGEPGKDKQAQVLSLNGLQSWEESSGVNVRELGQAYYCVDNFAVFHSALRPIDDVLECLAIGSVPVDKCIKAIRWLLSKGYEANEQKDQVWYRDNRQCGHMPELLIDLLDKASDMIRVEGIYEIISTLHKHGYALPYNMNLHRYHITRNDQKSKPDLIRRWVGKWMHTQCWSQSTNLGNLLWGLFLDIADQSTGWKESYQGEAASILERKIQVLIEYEAVTSSEVVALQSIVAALRDNPLEFKLIDGENDGKEYWETLCNTLHPFSRDENFLANNLLLGLKRDTERRQRLHSFIVEADWNPWMVWHDYKMQCPKHRANLSHPWMKHWTWKMFQRRNGKWYDSEWVTFVEVNYDEFVAAAESLWLAERISGRESQVKDETTENSTEDDSRSEKLIEEFERRCAEIRAELQQIVGDSQRKREIQKEV
ncbi:uncharacterized protein FSUBG_1938 [Fusarium subglutinans]|uniref:Uncharacterized protein n=1 Tax=Gibberella subglutinans TaxID=42677 RepID=A0A8H5V620_GIBSU|nr:uncharacterized protein FSUBG_1938 [Fusarium subglutinans]KAF5611911.1 hypothetical protein FSUBG_1938 [Fusarium subglutinans]